MTKENRTTLLAIMFFMDALMIWGILSFLAPTSFPNIPAIWLKLICASGSTPVFAEAAGGMPVAQCLSVGGAVQEISLTIFLSMNALIAFVLSSLIAIPVSWAFNRSANEEAAYRSAVQPAEPSAPGRSINLTYGGQTYQSPADLPEEARASYDSIMRLFKDENHDNIPDMFQGGLLDLLIGLKDLTVKLAPVKDEFKDLMWQRQRETISQEEFLRRMQDLIARL